MVVDEVDLALGFGGEHGGGEAPLDGERIDAHRDGAQAGADRPQLGEGSEAHQGAGVGAGQVLGALDRARPQSKGEGGGAQHGDVVVAGAGRGGRRREHRGNAETFEERVQQHRPRVAAGVLT